MAPLPITKEGIMMKCRNTGIEVFMIICSILILFENGSMQAIMPSGIRNWVTFILPFNLGYLAYVGWGLIQMGKLIREDEANKSQTPAHVPSLFKGPKDQVISRLRVHGLIHFALCAGLFVLLGIGLAGNKISGMTDNLLVSVAIVFICTYHGYLGFVLSQLSEVINTDPSLFHIAIAGNPAPGKTENHTASMSFISPAVGLSQGVEQKGINTDQEENR